MVLQEPKKIMNLNIEDLERYSRNILLPEIGGNGQGKLLKAKVLVVGAGGLGSPLIIYLAACGVGNITIIDYDNVELSNLQRQIIHTTKEIGLNKTESAKNFVKQINPNIKVSNINSKLAKNNIEELISQSDIIADGSDNFETRYLVADTSYKLGKVLVSAAITKFEGQISTWKNYPSSLPCFRCLFPHQPLSANQYNCSSNGVLGSVAGFLGSLQATEVIKEILEIGNSLAGYLNIYDLLNNNFRKIKVSKDPKCEFCNLG